MRKSHASGLEVRFAGHRREGQRRMGGSSGRGKECAGRAARDTERVGGILAPKGAGPAESGIRNLAKIPDRCPNLSFFAVQPTRLVSRVLHPMSRLSVLAGLLLLCLATPLLARDYPPDVPPPKPTVIPVPVVRTLPNGLQVVSNPGVLFLPGVPTGSVASCRRPLRFRRTAPPNTAGGAPAR